MDCGKLYFYSLAINMHHREGLCKLHIYPLAICMHQCGLLVRMLEKNWQQKKRKIFDLNEVEKKYTTILTKKYFRKILFSKNRSVLFFPFTKKPQYFYVPFIELGGQSCSPIPGEHDPQVRKLKGTFPLSENAKHWKKTEIEKMQSAGATDEKIFFWFRAATQHCSSY